jgi:hypothetical protein
MTKTIFFLILIITSLNFSCNQDKKQNSAKDFSYVPQKILNDTSKFLIIEYNKESKWVFNKKCRNVNLSKNDISKIEILLNKSVNEYNIEAEKHLEKLKEENPKIKFDKENSIINLDKYKRQYVAVLNNKNEKEVWVNCFCGKFTEDDKKNILIVNDGGNCFFNLKINLTKNNYYDFSVNGQA